MSDSVQPDFTWRKSPSVLSLSAGVVHVWLLHDEDLDSAASHVDVLAVDERARAARLGERGARSYVATRSTLRSLLARYCGLPPREITFSYGRLGKPAFDQGGVHFSVSHAGDRALLAFSRSFPLGVDVEKTRHHRRFDALTARFFSNENAARIARASHSALPRVFAEAWAQREAYVKAVGGGLYATPDALPFIPGRDPARIVADASGAAWLVASIDVGDDFEAKLVVQAAAAGDAISIACYRVT